MTWGAGSGGADWSGSVRLRRPPSLESLRSRRVDARNQTTTRRYYDAPPVSQQSDPSTDELGTKMPGSQGLGFTPWRWWRVSSWKSCALNPNSPILYCGPYSRLFRCRQFLYGRERFA